ncbi:MAG TPA: hypothetical protein VHF89_03290 [Solirubrobacteraceae bacterium]|nr:hypothetical protein [Solirubrobacteraceae bacterium]
MLQAARRIGDGQWPYRDFWWNYGPGQPVLLAPFGGSLVAWRVIRIALNAVVAWLAYRLARRYGAGERAALLAWLAVACAMAWPAGPGPNPTALALAFGALLLAPGRAAGALAGVASVFRPEIGVAAAIATGRRGLAAAAAAGALLWLPFLVVAPGDLLDQTVGFLGIQGLQRLPFPLEAPEIDPNKLLEFYAPLVLVLGTALAALARPPLALVPLAAVGLAYLLGRTDEFHLVPLAAVLPVALVAARRLRVAALAVTALIALHGLDRIATQDRDEPAWDARDARIVDAVGDRTLFVAPPRFDQVTVGNPLLYVLAGADNPTRYDVVQPGVVTKEEVQREIVRDLERARPELLVRWTDPRTAPEDNGAGRSSGVTHLDDHLRARYRLVRRVGHYELHERR